MALTDCAATCGAMIYVSDCFLPVNADSLVLTTGLKPLLPSGLRTALSPGCLVRGM